MASSATVAHRLGEIVDTARVTETPAELQGMAIDGIIPKAAVSPETPEQVAAVLQLCRAEDWVVVPAGGLTGQHIGRPPQRVDVLLRTSLLTGVEHYDPGDLTIGIGAGASLAAVNELLTANRQMLPFSSPRPQLATVGGALARSAHDPRRQGYGSVRDCCIGIRFATADGKIVKAGGRVVKNVAGFDLMRLLIGSYGTLGVIVSANFKVFPQARQTRTFLCRFETLAAALAFRDRIVSSALLPMCLELLSPAAASLLEVESAWTVLLRAAGSEAVLARYRHELGSALSQEMEAASETALWDSLAALLDSPALGGKILLALALSLPLSAIESAANLLQAAAASHGFLCALVASIGVGYAQCALVPSGGNAGPAVCVAVLKDVRAALPAGSSAVVLRCPRELKPNLDIWGPCPTDLDSMRALKRALDDTDILNRGRFLF